jgi:hypothetical protein
LLLATYVGTTAATCWFAFTRRRPVGALLAFLGLAAVLLHLEAAILLPYYSLQYHSYLMVFLAFIATGAAQGLVLLAWKAAGRFVVIRRPAIAEGRS